MGERKGARGLELWCKKITNGYPGVNITNMTTSWRDGLAFCAIIHHFRPELIDFNKLKKDDIYYNNELAFNIAERHFGIPALLEPHDMVEFEVPDRLSILTYLSQFYQTFRMSQDCSDQKLNTKRKSSDNKADLQFKSFTFDQKISENDPDLEKCIQFWKTIVKNNFEPLNCECKPVSNSNNNRNRQRKFRKSSKDDVERKNNGNIKFWMDAVKEIQKLKLDDIKLKASKDCKKCNEPDMEESEIKREIKELNNWTSPRFKRPTRVDVKPTEEGLKNSLRQIHLESVGGNTLTSKSSMVQGDHTTPKTSLMQSSKVSYSELPKQSILQQTPKTSITQNLKTSITNTGGITASSKAKVLKNSVTLPKESLVKNDNIKRASEKSTIDSKLTKINSTIVGLIDECNDKHITDDDKLKKLKSVDEKLFDDVCDECDCGCGLEFCLCQATLKKPPINSGDNCHCVPKTKAQIENEENAVCKCGCDTEGCLCMAETLPCSCYWNDNDDDDDDDSGDSADDLPNSKGIQCELIKSNTCKQCTT